MHIMLHLPAVFYIINNVGHKTGDDAEGCWHTRPLCHGGCIKEFSRRKSII